MHRDASQKFKKEMEGLGLKTVSAVNTVTRANQAHSEYKGVSVSRNFGQRHDCRILPWRLQGSGYPPQATRVSTDIAVIYGVQSNDWFQFSSKDIVVAAGLHKDIKDKYFRVGHMGVSVVDTERGDLDRVIKGIKDAFAEAGYKRSWIADGSRLPSGVLSQLAKSRL
jgi:hypothetical protein